MVSKAFLIAVAIVATIVAPTMAKEFVVGGYNGWTLGIDYQAWAAGKEFHVGDTLVFRYRAGAHNVVKVNGTDFQSCVAPLNSVPLTTGNDVITLATPGKKWYICSVGRHCTTGPMKLAINVLPGWGNAAPAPAATPKPNPGSGTIGIAPKTAKKFVVGDYDGWALGIDYQAWAAGKEFHVGDTLVFNYKVGVHNVIKVNGTDFQACTKPLNSVPLTTGSDVITLATPGKKWYICGVGSHCLTGPMKLAINVLPGLGYDAPAPSPKPNSGYGSMEIVE